MPTSHPSPTVRNMQAELERLYEHRLAVDRLIESLCEYDRSSRTNAPSVRLDTAPALDPRERVTSY